jgi:hypothetical protein
MFRNGLHISLPSGAKRFQAVDVYKHFTPRSEKIASSEKQVHVYCPRAESFALPF